jgi:hypothetical protein
VPPLSSREKNREKKKFRHRAYAIRNPAFPALPVAHSLTPSSTFPTHLAILPDRSHNKENSGNNGLVLIAQTPEYAGKATPCEKTRRSMKKLPYEKKPVDADGKDDGAVSSSSSRRKSRVKAVW